MGSSCMSKSITETQSLHVDQCNFKSGFQQNVYLDHPKKVLETISSVSSYSSINSFKSNQSPLYSNYQGLFIDPIKQDKIENSQDQNQNRTHYQKFLLPSQCNFSPQKSNQSELSIELQENQTISLTIPKRLIQYRKKFCSQRRVYSKKDLLKSAKKQRKSEVLSAKIDW